MNKRDTTLHMYNKAQVNQDFGIDFLLFKRIKLHNNRFTTWQTNY